MLISSSPSSSSSSGGGYIDSTGSSSASSSLGGRRRRRRTRTNSSVSEFGQLPSEEELKSWKLSNHERHSRSRTLSSDNKSLLDFTVLSSSSQALEGRSAGDEEEEEEEDGEILIIDKTKSKGFSTLLGREYDQFININNGTSSFTIDNQITPTNATFQFPPPPSSPSYVQPRSPTTTTTTCFEKGSQSPRERRRREKRGKKKRD